MMIKIKSYLHSALFIFALQLFLTLPSGLSAASEQSGAAAPEHSARLVKIGYYEDNHEFQHGFSDATRKSGYAYEYYQQIAKNAGWRYQYVYGTWPEIYDKLLSGEVDIMAGISRTDVREQQMLFPDAPMGEESYYIFVPAEYNGIAADDVSSLNGKRIGVNEKSLMLEIFKQFVKENELSCVIKTYSGQPASAEALKNGEIDGYIITDNFLQNGIKPVMKIGESDIFLAVNKNRSDLLRELNAAQAQIRVVSPYYISYLQSKYFGKNSLELAFNDDELKWMAKEKRLVLGYHSDYLPYCAAGPDGQAEGVIVTLQQEISNYLNIPVELRAFKDSQAMLNALNAGSIHAIFPFYSDNWVAEQQNLNLSIPLFSSSAIALYNGTYNSTITAHTAVIQSYMIQQAYLKRYYPDSRKTFYASLDEAVAALQSGKVSCIIGDSNRMLFHVKEKMQDPDFSFTYLEHPIEFSFAFLRGQNILQSILDKAIINIENAKLTEAIIRSSHEQNSYSLMAFIRHKPVMLSSLLCTILVFLLIIFCLYRRNSIRSQQKLTAANKALKDYQIQTSETLSGAKTSLWTIELKDGRPPRLIGDATMHELFGIASNLPPETCYQTWTAGIDKQHIEQINQCMQEVSKSGRFEISYPWKQQENRTVYLRMGGVPDQHAAANTAKIKGYLQDITETEFIKLKMEEAQRESAAKSVFLSSMSHEIRTPLNAIIGFSGLLENTGLLESERREYLHNINISGKALLSLINDILDLSKLEAAQMKYQNAPFDLGLLISNISQVFGLNLKEKNLHLVTTIPPDLPFVVLDEQRMRQVIFNLLGNAVKFTSVGSIEIAVDYVPLETGSGHLTIRVKDTGIGMSGEFQKKLFKPFIQANENKADHTQGTGLGLAISRRLVNGMGGELSVVSRKNEGSTFIADFPKIEISHPAKNATAEKNEFHTSLKRVLLVDDIEMNLKVLSAILKNLGIEAVPAKSGLEALKILDMEYHAIDLVMTDLWMPGMNGIDLAVKLKADPRFLNLPVVAVSADIEGKNNTDAQIFTGFVFKPISADELMKLFRSLENMTKGKTYPPAEAHEALRRYQAEQHCDVSDIPPDNIGANEVITEMQNLANTEKLNQKILSAFAENHSLDILLPHITEIFFKQFDCDRIMLIQCDADDLLRIRQEWLANGTESLLVHEIEKHYARWNAKLEMLRNNGVIKVADIRQSGLSGLAEQDLTYKTTSFIAAPIFVKGALWGVFSVSYTRSSEKFNDIDERIMRTCAGVISLAIIADRSADIVAQTEKNHRLIMDNIHIPIWLHDAHGRLISVNTAAETLLGVSSEHLTTEKNHEILVSAFGSDREQPIEETLRTGKTVTREMKLGGREYIVTGEPVIQNGALTYIVKTAVDMTDFNVLLNNQKAMRDCMATLLSVPDAEKAVEKTLCNLCEYLGASRSYVFSVNEEKRTMSSFVEYAPDEEPLIFHNIKNKPFSSSPNWIDRFKSEATVCITNLSAVEKTEYGAEWYDDVVKYDMRSIYATRLIAGTELCGYLGVIFEHQPRELNSAQIDFIQTVAHFIEVMMVRNMDHSELLSALQRAENADRAKSFFIASVSHEIRTPLNAVIGFSELLKDETIDSATRTDYLDSINYSGNALLQLINDVLDLSKLEADQMEIIPESIDFRVLGEEVMRVFAMSASQKKLELRMEIPALPNLLLDKMRVRQILLNFIGNSVKFTLTGSVTLSAGFRPLGTSHGEFFFAVTDTGIGIDAKDQKRLLDPFVQLSKLRGTNAANNGTGLGLSICKRLAAKMGGEIWVDSELGKGSTFGVRLFRVSLAQENPPEKHMVQSLPRSGNESLSALLVDDVEMNLKVLKIMCMKTGMTDIVLANSGECALAELAKRSFSMMMTDIWMPGMNGAELAEKVRTDKKLVLRRYLTGLSV